MKEDIKKELVEEYGFFPQAYRAKVNPNESE